jgi:hypothetical protein
MIVITGLDPVIHLLHKNLAQTMDARVKPAHDSGDGNRYRRPRR